MENKKISIAIGVDHRAYKLKEFLIKQKKIDSILINWIDCGTHSEERTDYPIYTKKVVDLLLCNQVQKGILSCGSGIGMAIAANRHKGIYAGLVWSEEITKMAKSDDNINILVLPSDFIDFNKSLKIIYIWLSTKFKADRYLKRLQLIDKSV